MRLSQAWTITLHDLELIRARRSIYLSLVLLPVGIGIGFPLLVRYILQTTPTIPPGALTTLIGAFEFWFAIAGAMLPTAIATYSIVGEKIEKSLEPLLATPSTDGEILLGKALAAWLPTMAAVWAGSVIYMALMDRIVAAKLGAFYYPNVEMAVILLALAPVTCLVAVLLSVVVSARVTDVRSAQQASGLLFLPFMLIYVFGEAGVIPLDQIHLLEISGGFALVALALFDLTRRTFHRDEILTRWK